MGASSRQGQAFAAYLELGPDRSLAALANALQKDPAAAGLRRPLSLRTLEGWSGKFHWQERITEIDRKAREEVERQHLELVKQRRERLLQQGLLLQEQGIEWLSAMDPEDVKATEAIRAIEAGVKLEALALGEATERITVEVDDNERLERLTDEELDLLIQQAREAQRNCPAPEIAARPE